MENRLHTGEIKDTEYNASQKAETLSGLCTTIESNASALQTALSTINGYIGKRSTNNDALENNTNNEYVLKDYGGPPYEKDGVWYRDLDYTVKYRIWNFDFVSEETTSALTNIINTYIVELAALVDDLKKALVGVEITAEDLEDLVQDEVDEFSDSEYLNDAVLESDARKTGAEDEYSAASGTNTTGITKESEQYYKDATLRLRQDPTTKSVCIEKWDAESGTWVGMKWIPEETAKDIVRRCNEKQKEKQQQTQTSVKSSQDEETPEKDFDNAAKETEQNMDNKQNTTSTTSEETEPNNNSSSEQQPEQSNNDSSPSQSKWATSLPKDMETSPMDYAQQVLSSKGLDQTGNVATSESFTGEESGDGDYTRFSYDDGTYINIYKDLKQSTTSMGTPKLMEIHEPESKGGRVRQYSVTNEGQIIEIRSNG